MGSNVTLKQIADALDISAMTVSRALNNRENVDEQTRERIVEKARELGYTPNHIAKSLVSQKTNTIGVVIPEIAHSFFAQAIQGIEEEIFDDEYQLILTHSAEQDERERKALETLKAKRVDGILISAAQNTHNEQYYKQIIESGTEMVFFDRYVENIGASCVKVDDNNAAYNITNHLLGHGYKSVAHLSAAMDISIGRDRFKGFKAAMQDHNLPVEDQYVVPAELHEEGGYQAMKTLLELPEAEQPRAVFAVNDPVAFGAMDAIYEQGLSIPEDIAIVGFSNDNRASLMESPLTTVVQPAYELGRRAARKLISHIENENEMLENVELLTKLKIRESCGCKTA